MLVIEAPRFANRKDDSFWATSINSEMNSAVKSCVREKYNIKIANSYQFTDSKFYQQNNKKIYNETIFRTPRKSEFVISRVKQRSLNYFRKEFKNR